MPKLKEGNESILPDTRVKRPSKLLLENRNGAILHDKPTKLIKTAMRERRIGYSEMARRLGITKQAVYERLNTRDDISVELMVDMLTVCGYSMYVMRDNTSYAEFWKVW